MKTGITFGTFDMFHYGHLRILQRARALCDRLVVGVSSDEFIAGKNKSHGLAFPYEQRAAIVAELRCLPRTPGVSTTDLASRIKS